MGSGVSINDVNTRNHCVLLSRAKCSTFKSLCQVLSFSLILSLFLSLHIIPIPHEMATTSTMPIHIFGSFLCSEWPGVLGYWRGQRSNDYEHKRAKSAALCRTYEHMYINTFVHIFNLDIMCSIYVAFSLFANLSGLSDIKQFNHTDWSFRYGYYCCRPTANFYVSGLMIGRAAPYGGMEHTKKNGALRAEIGISSCDQLGDQIYTEDDERTANGNRHNANTQKL